jgi:hypothetical protein
MRPSRRSGVHGITGVLLRAVGIAFEQVHKRQ